MYLKLLMSMKQGAGDIEVVHCPTKLMIADILTKPLQPAQFLYLRDYLLGCKIPEKGCVK